MHATTRRYFLGTLLFTLALSLFAAQKNKAVSDYQLTVAADRKEAVYRQGDTITFRIQLAHKGQPLDGVEVQWMTSKDGVVPKQEGKTKLVAGAAAVQAVLNEPGFVRCDVTFAPPQGAKIIALGGAAVSPTEIRPSMPVPADFDAFWTAQKKQLAAVPANPKLTPAKIAGDKLEAFDLQVASLGAPVSGYFVRPIGAKKGSLPAILTVHGAGVRSSSLTAASGWAGRGFLALDINAHGLPNGKPTAYYTELANGALKDYRARGRESRDTIYFREMFLRLVRAIDFLTAQPEWDGRTMVVQGSSQGGFQAIVAAGIDSRVTFFAAGVPAGCDHTGFRAGRINGWPKFIATGEAPAPAIVAAVRYYDAVNFASRAKVPGFFTVGFIDTTCPPSTVYAAFNALPSKKDIVHNVAAGHTNTPAANEATQAAIMRHAEAMRRR